MRKTDGYPKRPPKRRLAILCKTVFCVQNNTEAFFRSLQNKITNLTNL